MKQLSVHKLRTFRLCPRLYFFRCVLKVEPVKKAEALAFGSLYHAGLNAWWDPFHHRHERREAAIAALRAHWEANWRMLDAYQGVTAEELMLAYDARWADDVSVRPIGVEVEYEATLDGSPWTRFGRMDLVVSVLDGELAIGEHKTSASDLSPGSPYWNQLRIDTQVSEYMRGGAARYGREIAHVMYDVTLKPDIAPFKATPPDKRKFTKGKPCRLCRGKGTAVSGLPCSACHGSTWEEAPHLYANMRDRDEHPEEWRRRLRDWMAKQPFMFARRTIPRLPDELLEADRAAVHTGRMIDHCYEVNVWPQNDHACGNQYGRPCDYRDVCNMVASIDDKSRFRTRGEVAAASNDRPQEDSDGHEFAEVSDPDQPIDVAPVTDVDAEE